MPAKKKKLPSGEYAVSTPNAVHAKGTTKEKAEKQVRLLNAIEHGFVPTGGTRGNVSGGEMGDYHAKRGRKK